MLPLAPVMVMATVHKFWSLLWKKAMEKALLVKMVTIATMNTGHDLVLNGEVYNTLLGFAGKLDQADVKANKIFNDLQGMGSANTKQGYENVALRSKAEIFASTKADIKVKVESTLEKLAEATAELENIKEELAIVKASVTEAEMKAVRLYMKNFLSTPEYFCLVALFMEAGGDN
ncbi:hypothetical protein Adt_21152 [Abeliophyllum distichum]|uniref:Uncharacterized protein n=1 Tax=Abeliophyllum distichum TaxID=126358 RepID=A0ABD1SYI8_9LAMI